MGSGWHLDRVEVYNKKDGNVHTFVCKKWLDKSEGDGKIERVLSVKLDSNASDEAIRIPSRKSSAGSINSQNLKVSSRAASKTSKQSSGIENFRNKF